ncbi:MAG: alginate export family protein [Planctomycetota bacterium]
MGCTWRAAWLALGLLASFAHAQSDAQRLQQLDQALEAVLRERYERSGDKSLAETARVDYGVYTIFSGIAADRTDRTTRLLAQVDSRIWARAEWQGSTVYGRLRLHYQWFDVDRDSYWAAGDGFRYPLGDRWWYQFDWRRFKQTTKGEDPGWSWNTRIGRQLVTWGTGITLYRTLYSARLNFELSKAHIQAMVGQTPDHDFIDFDASRPNYTSETDRLFWGVLADWRGWSDHQPFVYFLQQIDNNDTTLSGGGRYRYDSSYASIGSTGQFSGMAFYRAELIYEFGTSASDILGSFPQTDDDISAWALKFEVILTPRRYPKLRDFRLELELLLGSGDSDRNHSSHTVGGNQAGTNDNSFNAFGYWDTGLVLALDLANLISLRVGPRWRPFRKDSAGSKISIGLDFFLFGKLDDDAPVSVTTIPGESYIGFETDLIIEWQMTSDTALDLRYGIFLPGSAFPGSATMHFLYLGVSYGF